MPRGSRPSRNYIESLVSPSEAAQMMGVSGQWVSELCRKGSLKAYKTPLGWLIDPEDIQRVAAQRLQKMEQVHSKASEFAKRFYEKHGEAMSRLAKR